MVAYCQVNPARAGMIPPGGQFTDLEGRKPRASGDDPFSVFLNLFVAS